MLTFSLHRTLVVVTLKLPLPLSTLWFRISKEDHFLEKKKKSGIMTIEACVSKAVFKPWLSDLIELFLVWGAIRCIYKARFQSRLVGVTNIQLLVAQIRSSTKWSANLLHSKRKDLIGWQRKFGAVKFWSISHDCERQRAFSLCRSQASDLVDLVACLN